MVNPQNPANDKLKIHISGYSSLKELWSLLKTVYRLRRMVEAHGFEPVVDALEATADRPGGRATVRRTDTEGS